MIDRFEITARKDYERAELAAEFRAWGNEGLIPPVHDTDSITDVIDNILDVARTNGDDSLNDLRVMQIPEALRALQQARERALS